MDILLLTVLRPMQQRVVHRMVRGRRKNKPAVRRQQLPTPRCQQHEWKRIDHTTISQPSLTDFVFRRTEVQICQANK